MLYKKLAEDYTLVEVTHQFWEPVKIGAKVVPKLGLLLAIPSSPLNLQARGKEAPRIPGPMLSQSFVIDLDCVFVCVSVFPRF